MSESEQVNKWLAPSFTSPNPSSAPSQPVAQPEAVDEQAKERGYEQGLSQAKAEYQQKIAQIEQVLAQLTQAQDRINDDLQSALNGYCQTVVLKVLGQALKDPQTLEQFIQQGLNKLRGQPSLRLVLPQSMASDIQSLSDTFSERGIEVEVREDELSSIEMVSEKETLVCSLDSLVDELMNTDD